MKLKALCILATLLCVFMNSAKVNAEETEVVLPEGYQKVIDLFKEIGEIKPGYFADYMLFDVTNDGQPELWVQAGTCEADMMVYAFTLENGKPRQIYRGNGSHSDFYVDGGKLLLIDLHMDIGSVISFEYSNGELLETHTPFMYTEDGDIIFMEYDDIGESGPEVVRMKADPEVIRIMEEIYWDSTNLIPLTPIDMEKK